MVNIYVSLSNIKVDHPNAPWQIDQDGRPLAKLAETPCYAGRSGTQTVFPEARKERPDRCSVQVPSEVN